MRYRGLHGSGRVPGFQGGDDGEVTLWLERLKAGDQDAAQRLWEGYFARLVGLARKKLGSLPRRAADEEDVALSAFKSFWRGAERGRFPRLDDRDDLWQVLVLITARKAYDLRRHEQRQKRGGSAVTASAVEEEAAEAEEEELAYRPRYEPALNFEWTSDGLVVLGPSFDDPEVADPTASLGKLLPGDLIVGLEVPMLSKAQAGVSVRDALEPCVAAGRKLLA